MEQTASRSWLAIRQPSLLREILLVGFGYLLYSQVRGLAADRVVEAFGNARDVVELERGLGIFEELALQAWVLPHELLVHFFNLVYFYGLFPLLVPTAFWLFFRRPHVYVLARNAFLASGVIAVCLYLAVPTAPPRLLDMGFIDTLGRSLTPSYSSIPGVNPYAAVPSMHVGWNFLTAAALYLALPQFRFRALVLLLPLAMFTATVATGNHYFIDGLLGILVASMGLGIALYIRDRGQRRDLPADQAPVSS
jgi:hypothetical protein